MSGQPGRILVVENDGDSAHNVIWVFSGILTQRGFTVTAASDVVEALEQARRHPFDVMLTDMRMQETGGPVFLRTFQRLQPETPMIVVNPTGSADAAREAMEAGAFTYITPPFSVENARHAIDLALSHAPPSGSRRPGNGHPGHPAGLVGHSRAMAGVGWAVAQAAMDETPVLIQGETGTGKGLVARSIHLLSDRASAPFLTVRCADLPDEILARTLFGYDDAREGGPASGSLEAASGGTLVIDEVDDLGLDLQERLLGLLDDSGTGRPGPSGRPPPKVRIVSTSSVDIVSLVHMERFRIGLYRILTGLKILLPPLRNRQEDLPLLAEHFLRKLAALTNKTVAGVSPEAMDRLLRHHWPGNVRELREVIERAFIVTGTPTIQLKDLPAAMRTECEPSTMRASRETAPRREA